MDRRKPLPTWQVRWRGLWRQYPRVTLLLSVVVIILVLYATRKDLAWMPRYLLGEYASEPFNNTRPDVCQRPAERKYQPTDTSLSSHPLPSWFKSTRFGIFIHWGLYSVPAWAETGHSFEQFNKGVSPEQHFKHNPYAEWYLNTVRLRDSGAEKHHLLAYNEKPRDIQPSRWYYSRFAEEFDKNLPQWKPELWARIFADSGAGYVVLTTKHHDGYCLWPSKVEHPLWKQWAGKEGAPRYPSQRDIVGELSKAVRASGLQMGLYYSGGLDWSFKWEIDACFDDPTHKAKCHPGIPNDSQYAKYAGAQLQELISKYKPAILWDDINWPEEGKRVKFGHFSLPSLISNYFNEVCPSGLVNDRWHLHTGAGAWKWTGDIGTPEYSQHDQVQGKVFETCRGIGKSFGFNQVEEESEDCKAYMSIDEAIELLIATVAKNGNLLLDVGPDGQGRIPVCQQNVLQGVGKWLTAYGSSVMNTIPYVASGSIIKSSDPVRYMQSADHGEVHVIILGNKVKPASEKNEALRIFPKRTVPPLQIRHNNLARLILPTGGEVLVAVQQNADDMSVFIPWAIVPRAGNRAWVLRFFVSSSSYYVRDCRVHGPCVTFK